MLFYNKHPALFFYCYATQKRHNKKRRHIPTSFEKYLDDIIILF